MEKLQIGDIIDFSTPQTAELLRTGLLANKGVPHRIIGIYPRPEKEDERTALLNKLASELNIRRKLFDGENLQDNPKYTETAEPNTIYVLEEQSS